jgi:hypothetical protein
VRDVAAIDEWVRLHADEDQAVELKKSLPSLPVGTAWLWSPGWLGVLERIKVRSRRTFDSSATPKPGQRRVEPKRFAEVDLIALGERISATVERAKADDPSKLKRRIAELEKQLAVVPEPQTVQVEVPIFDEDLVLRLEGVLGDLQKHGQQAADVAEELLTKLQTAKAASAQPPTPPRSVPVQRPVPERHQPGPPRREPSEGGPLPIAQRKILTVLAQHGSRTTTQLALLTGYSHKSGGFRNSLSTLRTSGFIEGRGEVTATEAGLEALGDWEPLPSGRNLIDWWGGQLGKAERAILEVLVAEWPRSVPVADIAERTGYSASSGGFRNSLSRLRTLQLASGRGELVAADELGATS